MPRNGGDRRGSASERRRRKTWMIAMFGDALNGTCPCTHCQKELNYDTVEADRIIPGGTYHRNNVQPSCRPCNVRRGDSPVTPYPPHLPVHN